MRIIAFWGAIICSAFTKEFNSGAWNLKTEQMIWIWIHKKNTDNPQEEVDHCSTSQSGSMGIDPQE
jgi:hypothetical protein